MKKQTERATKMGKAKFVPTKDMIEAAKAVFMAKAFVETIKPIVTEYQTKVLNELKLKDARTGELITNPKHMYLADKSEWPKYFERINEERIKAKLHVDNPEHCPLLVAESMLRQARNLLIEVMEPITKISLDRLVLIEHKEELVELSLKLLAPFVKEVM